MLLGRLFLKGTWFMRRCLKFSSVLVCLAMLAPSSFGWHRGGVPVQTTVTHVRTTGVATFQPATVAAFAQPTTFVSSPSFTSFSTVATVPQLSTISSFSQPVTFNTVPVSLSTFQSMPTSIASFGCSGGSGGASLSSFGGGNQPAALSPLEVSLLNRFLSGILSSPGGGFGGGSQVQQQLNAIQTDVATIKTRVSSIDDQIKQFVDGSNTKTGKSGKKTKKTDTGVPEKPAKGHFSEIMKQLGVSTSSEDEAVTMFAARMGKHASDVANLTSDLGALKQKIDAQGSVLNGISKDLGDIKKALAGSKPPGGA
jgi:hypothetical protein